MKNKEKNFVSAILYVRNNKELIEESLKTVIKVLQENFEHSEIICVNDFSTDGSDTIIREISQEVSNINITLINLSYFHGIEVAMQSGLDLAIGDFVFEFDTMQFDYEDNLIMDIYFRSLKGYDIVCACPRKNSSLLSSIYYSLFNSLSNKRFNMRTESFRVLSRRVINRIGLMNNTIPYRKAIYSVQGLKTDSIIYKQTKNKKYVNKDKDYRLNLAVDSLIIFTNLGYKFAISMTIFMMLVSLATIIYSIAIYLTSNPVTGWTTTILFLSIAFFGLFGLFTIVIKYMQLIINQIYKKKNYTYESIEKLTK